MRALAPWSGGVLVYPARAVSLAALWGVGGPLLVLLTLVGADTAPRLARWLLQTSGGGFVKLGQILAMRYDRLPAAWCDELQRLLDQLEPMPIEVVRRSIEKDLGGPLERVFVEFDERPIGSASVAQVHVARLRSGERVAVKVLRADVERVMAMDVAFVRLATRLFERSGLSRKVRVRELATEFEALTREELDLRAEARRAHRLHTLMASDDVDHRAPRVYFELSGARTLTLEFFEGIWMRELLDAVREGDPVRLAGLRARGADPARIARLLFRSIMEQCYRHRMFHADPHAGNLVVLEGGTLGFIDFGMVGWLDENLWRDQYRLFDAIASWDVHGAFEAMLDSMGTVDEGDVSDFEREFKSLLRDWMLAAENPWATLQEKSSGLFLLRASDAMRRAGFDLPWAVTRLHRTTMIADMIELKLDPELDLVEEMREFYGEDKQRRAQELLCTIEAARASGLAEQAARLPERVLRLVEWADRRLPPRVRAYGARVSWFERAFHRQVGSLRRWSLFVGGVTGGVLGLSLLPGDVLGPRVLAALDNYGDTVFWVFVGCVGLRACTTELTTPPDE